MPNAAQSTGLGPILYIPAGSTGGPLTLKFTRADTGAAIDLTAATAIALLAKRSLTLADADADVYLTVGSGITVTDAVAGIVSATIPAATTAALVCQEPYFYFARATLLSGEIVIPDLLRGWLYTDLRSALNQSAANGDCLIRVSPPSGTLLANAPDMSNYIINRYDLTGLTGGATTTLDGLSAATLSSLTAGARVVLSLTATDGLTPAEKIRAEYQLGAIGTDVEAAPFIVVCDNDTTLCWRLDKGTVSKGGQPATYNSTSAKFHRIWAVGANGSAVPSVDPTGFSFPS